MDFKFKTQKVYKDKTNSKKESFKKFEEALREIKDEFNPDLKLKGFNVHAFDNWKHLGLFSKVVINVRIEDFEDQAFIAHAVNRIKSAADEHLDPKIKRIEISLLKPGNDSYRDSRVRTEIYTR